MTFSHISDMHLGQTQYGSPEREDDMYNAFNQAIDQSIKDHVEFVILSGDLFNNPNPGGRAIVSFGNSLKRLTDENIPTYFILGDHDISRIVSTPVAYIYHNLKVATYIGNSTPVKIGNTQIIGFDKIRRGEIPNCSERFLKADKYAKEHNGKSILVMHQGVIEANQYAGEIGSMDLPKSFSYYAMGHLHTAYKKRFKCLGGMLAYPGSTETSSNEHSSESEKGFYQVDISGSEATLSWSKLDTRPHKTYSLEHDDLQNRMTSILTEISECKKKPIVKIKIKGQHIDMNELHALATPLYDAALHCNIIPEQSIERSDIMSAKPTKMLDELLRYTKKALGDDKLAEFAINQLLKPLAASKIDDALELVQRDFAKFKSGNTQ